MASRSARGVRRATHHRVLAAVLLVGTAGSVALSAAVKQSEDRALQRAVDVKAGEAVLHLGLEFQTRLLALQRMSDRWTVAGGTRRDVWEEDAANYVADYGGFRAIERVDAEGRIAWVVPKDVYAHLLGYDLTRDEPRRAAMDEAWRRRRAAVSRPLELLTGGTGVLVFLPLYTRERFDGWIAGTFEIRELLSATVGPLGGGYRMAVTFAGEPLYADPRPTTDICSAQPLGVYYLGWRLEVCAGDELESAIRGPLPFVTLAVGLALTALTAGLVHALALAGDRERRARELATSLREKADALDRAQRELAELSWSVSHELRTPLRAIDGYAALLAEGTPGAGRQELARIRANAQRMAHQLDGLLLLLRVARAEVRPTDVDISMLARERLERLAADHPDREVLAHVDDGLVVRGDASLLLVVVNALVDNAWKFTAARRPGHITVARTPTGFSVTDDGVGFDMAFAHKLFGTFERLHAPGEFEGLGIGLSIAARAVGRHGGTIRAEGVPHQGATFFVDLPG